MRGSQALLAAPGGVAHGSPPMASGRGSIPALSGVNKLRDTLRTLRSARSDAASSIQKALNLGPPQKLSHMQMSLKNLFGSHKPIPAAQSQLSLNLRSVQDKQDPDCAVPIRKIPVGFKSIEQEETLPDESNVPYTSRQGGIPSTNPLQFPNQRPAPVNFGQLRQLGGYGGRVQMQYPNSATNQYFKQSIRHFDFIQPNMTNAFTSVNEDDSHYE